ncbi:MAG: 6,7-dimethyl-8-ribityllumazine synthase [Parcubacteria group bacterium]|nr:6,7-dimethyl-8-ribityllumazine synthase [Parcubacteria group bacterium]
MPKKIALVMGSFHKAEVTTMLEAARAQAAELDLEIVEEVWVMGSIEKPLALKRLLMRDDVDGAAVLGIIEKGETQHGFVMGQVVYDAIIQLQLEYMKPVGLGILGPGILPDQIQPRLKGYAQAAVVALADML